MRHYLSFFSTKWNFLRISLYISLYLLHCYVSQYAFSFIIYVAHTVNRSFQSYMYTTEIQCTGHTSVAYLYKHLRPRNKISRERIRYVCAQLSAHSRALGLCADTHFLHPVIALNRPINYANSFKGEFTRFMRLFRQILEFNAISWWLYIT